MLSIDAGGSRAVSQLLILKGLMDKLSEDVGGTQGPLMRPFDVFDLIGGVGTGGSVLLNQVLKSRRYLK
jgi:hypothetical protein